jgi:hypothetical protein
MYRFPTAFVLHSSCFVKDACRLSCRVETQVFGILYVVKENTLFHMRKTSPSARPSDLVSATKFCQIFTKFGIGGRPLQKFVEQA